MDEKQIADSFDSLKQKTLDFIRQGRPVHFHCEYDVSEDRVFKGLTQTICLGRPAEKEFAKDQQLRARFLSQFDPQPDYVATISE